MALVNTPRIPTIPATPNSPTSPRSSRSLYAYQPLCFHKEIFSSSSFNVDGFIADCRKRVPLESVRTDLREYSSSLENELVELINKDYTDFVNLSSNLAGIDEVLNELREPLCKIKDEAQAFNKRVQTIIENTEAKMQEKHEVIARKQYLRLFIAISASVDKLEHLLSSIPSVQVLEVPQFLDIAVYIDRIGNEYNMLRFYLAHAQKFSSSQAFVDKFLQRTTTLINSLEREVSKYFQTAVLNASKGYQDGQGKGRDCQTNERDEKTKEQDGQLPFARVVASCLRVYSALNKASSAYDIYREIVVKPRVQQIISAANLEKGSRGTCEGLKGIFEALLAFISSQCCPFLEDVRESFGIEYDFLANSVWIEIEETMNTRIGRIYNPGIPEIFLQNYRASFTFLSKIETIGCVTMTQLQSFRAHPAYTSFEKRWNTSVYRQLRFTEIASNVETALAQLQQAVPQPAETTQQELPFKLLGSRVLWRELNRIWSDSIFIFELTSQFVKLTLQLLARYSSWIAASYTTRIKPPPPAPSAETIATSDGAPPNASENVDEQAAAIWNKLVPGVYVFIYHDLVTLVSNLQGVFQQQVQSAMEQEGSLPSQALLDMLRETITTSASALLVHKSPLSNCITDYLTKKAIDNLQPLLGVTATYRLTDKRVPTRANYYVDDVVSVLATFTNSHVNVISSEVIKQWERQVLEHVTLKYEAMVAETLNNVYKAEATLSRMVKKNRQTTTSGSLSDIDKISLQLFLDVTKYGELLKSKLNIDASSPTSSFPPYLSLLARVSDGAKFKNLIADNSLQ